MIVETSTSNDMVVREGSNVSLLCKARGYPEPYVSVFSCFSNRIFSMWSAKCQSDSFLGFGVGYVETRGRWWNDHIWTKWYVSISMQCHGILMRFSKFIQCINVNRIEIQFFISRFAISIVKYNSKNSCLFGIFGTERKQQRG